MNDQRNSILTGNSQRLRKEMTKEERHLWYDCLKTLPVPFHRQKILGHFIVDFYCASAKLVIELDGSQHFSDKGLQDDKSRDEHLNHLGLTVKRYSNADINEKFESVCRDIYNFIFGDCVATPHPSRFP